jgi:hypothetical protein
MRQMNKKIYCWNFVLRVEHAANTATVTKLWTVFGIG